MLSYFSPLPRPCPSEPACYWLSTTHLVLFRHLLICSMNDGLHFISFAVLAALCPPTLQFIIHQNTYRSMTTKVPRDNNDVSLSLGSPLRGTSAIRCFDHFVLRFVDLPYKSKWLRERRNNKFPNFADVFVLQTEERARTFFLKMEGTLYNILHDIL